MPKAVEIRAEPAICSIPLHQAIYCENCNTISNSRPYRCGVCGSEAVLRVEPIFNRNPEPPAKTAFPTQLSTPRGRSLAGKRSTDNLRQPARVNLCLCMPVHVPVPRRLFGAAITTLNSERPRLA